MTGPTGPTGPGIQVSPTTLGNVLYANGQNFSATSTSNLFFDSVNTRVGIACNAPGFLLDVNGASRFSGNLNVPSFNYSSSINSIIRIGAGSPVQTFIQWGDGSGWQYNYLGASSRTTNVMTLEDRGRVGILCNAPTFAFDVNGNTQINGYAQMTGNTQHGDPSANGTTYLYHGGTNHSFYGQSVTTGAGTLSVYSTESNATGRGGSVALGARSTDFGGGQQLQIQARIAGIVEGSYNGAFIIQTCANGALPERFRITSGGYVGILCNSPACPLAIGNYNSFTVSGTSTYFGVGATGLTNGTNVGLNVSLQAPGFLVAGGLSASSDTRIKENIQDVQDDDALQRLRLIQPKTYTYKDVITRGTEPVYGFIAQQIRSVLPYSTNLTKEVIPDIYQLADIVEDIVTLRDSTFSFNQSSGKVRFIQKKVDNIIVPVNFISSNQLQILDTSKLDQTESEIFVYGREVDDFHTLNKDAIFTVNVAATQELDRQLQAAKAQIASLETRLALLESR
jgi:hypothetical protein